MLEMQSSLCTPSSLQLRPDPRSGQSWTDLEEYTQMDPPTIHSKTDPGIHAHSDALSFPLAVL